MFRGYEWMKKLICYLAALVDATCLLCGFITHLISTRQGSKGRFKCIPVACNLPIQLHYRANPTCCSNNFIFLHVYAGLGKAGELNTPKEIRDYLQKSLLKTKIGTCITRQAPICACNEWTRTNLNITLFDLIELLDQEKS